MKRMYLTPESIVIDFETAGMLCISGNLGGDATEPGKARMFDYGEDDWDEE